MKKKLFTFFILIVIIVGIVFAGYYVYNNFVKEDLGDLNEVVIPENDRDEIIDNLNTNKEKINMIIDLVNDINENKVIYNTKSNNEITFQIYDDYRIAYNISVIDAAKDYLNVWYSIGTEKYIKISALKTSYIYHYYEYLNETYVTDQYVETDLNYEDEICYGRVNKNYVSEIEHSFLADYVKDLTDINSFTFIEEQNKFSLSNNDYSIETDGNTYLNIIPYKSFIKEIHLELNNKSLYQELISNLPKFEDFPEINSELKPKTNHKQLLRDYISSIEPKNETYDVETVDDLKTSNSLNYDADDNVVKLYWNISGKINSEQTINVTLGLTIEMSDDVMTTTDDNGVKTVRIVADESNVVATTRGKTDVKSAVKDLSLDVVMVIKSDMSVTCQYSASLKYESEELSFNQEVNITESGKIVDKFIDVESLNSVVKGKITDLVVLDSYNNSYINKETSYEFAGKDSVVTLIAYYLYK